MNRCMHVVLLVACLGNVLIAETTVDQVPSSPDVDYHPPPNPGHHATPSPGHAPPPPGHAPAPPPPDYALPPSDYALPPPDYALPTSRHAPSPPGHVPAPPSPDYALPTPGQEDPYCHFVERIVFEDQCEPYVEKTCWTTNQEVCEPKEYENCTGIIKTTMEKECFDVSELVCDMVESINYETLEETYQVQRCYNGKDRVCDTTHKIDMTTKDDYQCAIVESPNCVMEERSINDITCTKTVEFDCKKKTPSEDHDSYTTPPEVVCERKPKEDCHEIPRKIHVEVCKTNVSRFCDKFANVFPFTIKEQKCHFEPKKICQLDMKTRPKKAKKYQYEKVCSEQPRKICDNVEKKSIESECEIQNRMDCKYVPVEQCNTEDKEYCHKVEKVKVEEVCDRKHATSYYHRAQRQNY